MVWVNDRLPCPLGFISNNFSNFEAIVPEIGKNGPSVTTLNHVGLMAGARTGVILFLDFRSAIIVLINIFGLTDTTNTVSQLLTEILFDTLEKNYFVGLTQKIIDVELNPLSIVAEELEQDRTLGTISRNLNEYFGTYMNALDTLKIEILLQNSKLALRL